jgi:hypothetical protein
MRPVRKLLDTPFFVLQTLSVTLREEYVLRVFENRVMIIFGPDSEEVPGGWKRIHY